MSTIRFTSPLAGFGGAALFALLAVSATAAFGGSVPIGTFETEKGGFYDVVESGPQVPPALYTPPAPNFSDTPSLQLNFNPANFSQFIVETSGTTPFDLQYKTGQILLPIVTKPITNDPNFAGWELQGLSLHLAGSYSLYAPFDGSKAKVSMAGQYTVQVTQLDWQPVSIPGTYTSPFVVVPDSVTTLGPQPGFVNGNWQGDVTVDWAAMRSAAGILPNQRITGATVQFTADIGAASIYGSARTSVLQFNATSPIGQVPAVPEPPTVILAGLGVAAAVGHGYRRRKQRRMAAGRVNVEHGAIALTA